VILNTLDRNGSAFTHDHEKVVYHKYESKKELNSSARK